MILLTINVFLSLLCHFRVWTVDYKTAPSFVEVRPPSSHRSPISRPRAKTHSKTPSFGLLAKEGAALQSKWMVTSQISV